MSAIDYGFGITSDGANNIIIRNNTVTGTGAHETTATMVTRSMWLGTVTEQQVTGNILHRQRLYRTSHQR